MDGLEYRVNIITKSGKVCREVFFGLKGVSDFINIIGKVYGIESVEITKINQEVTTNHEASNSHV